MGTIHGKTRHAWRATFVLLVLLFGAFAPAAKLVLPAPVSCGMECCEASGVCYCAHPSAEESADQSLGRDNARFESVALTAACPSRCAQIPAGFQKHAAANTSLPPQALITDAGSQICASVPQLVFDSLVLSLHAPRAPPLQKLA